MFAKIWHKNHDKILIRNMKPWLLWLWASSSSLSWVSFYSRKVLESVSLFYSSRDSYKRLCNILWQMTSLSTFNGSRWSHKPFPDFVFFRKLLLLLKGSQSLWFLSFHCNFMVYAITRRENYLLHMNLIDIPFAMTSNFIPSLKKYAQLVSFVMPFVWIFGIYHRGVTKRVLWLLLSWNPRRSNFSCDHCTWGLPILYAVSKLFCLSFFYSHGVFSLTFSPRMFLYKTFFFMYVNEIMEQKDKKEQQEENTKVLKEKRKRGPKEREELRRISPEKK